MQPFADICIAFDIGNNFKLYSVNATCDTLGETRSRALPCSILCTYWLWHHITLRKEVSMEGMASPWSDLLKFSASGYQPICAFEY